MLRRSSFAVSMDISVLFQQDLSYLILDDPDLTEAELTLRRTKIYFLTFYLCQLLIIMFGKFALHSTVGAHRSGLGFGCMGKGHHCLYPASPLKDR
jgi:hypothetical protein